MDWPSVVISVGLGLLLLLYVVPGVSATILLMRSDFFESWQRAVQLAIIWCLPILGAAVVVTILAPHVPRRRESLPWLQYFILGGFVSSMRHESGSDSTDGESNDLGNVDP
jgi:hypothetical protein